MTLPGGAPAFAITGGVPPALLRGLFDAALFTASGGLVFRTLVLKRAAGRMAAAEAGLLDRRLLALIRLGLIAALLLGAGWLLAEGGVMADAGAVGPLLAAMPTVVGSTRFGHLMVLQIAGLGVALLLLRRAWPALVVSTGVLLLQAGHGHGAAMSDGPSLLLLAGILHLLAGSAWLGGLLPLLLTVAIAPPRAGATAARSFSVLGKWCVGVMAGTAAYQGWVLVGSVPGLAGTAYGWMACVKLMLFGVLLGFAWVNRYRLAPALVRDTPLAARRRLVGSIAVQTGFGLAVLLAAGVLSSLPPAMHEAAGRAGEMGMAR